MIELKSVSGSFGKGAVTNVSLRLPNGKTYGVFSPCYEDAVALCTLMGGARTPLGGTVLVGGFDMHREAKKARRGIGFLPSDLLPDDELTPLEYLMAVAEARELPYEKTLRHVHELLELADLSDKKERLIAHLSHGEKRILCLLQVVLGKPEILILTSPLSGVLPKDALRICELIKYFGTTYTIFLCTPSLNDLRKMCDEIIVLQGGSLGKIVSSYDETLTAELTETAAEPVFDKESPKKHKSLRWSMLTAKSGDYEVLEDDGKEDDD